MHLKIDWEAIPEEYTKAAYDSTGYVYAYSGEVLRKEARWIPITGCSVRVHEEHILLRASTYFWHQSLIERPVEKDLATTLDKCIVEDVRKEPSMTLLGKVFNSIKRYLQPRVPT